MGEWVGGWVHACVRVCVRASACVCACVCLGGWVGVGRLGARYRADEDTDAGAALAKTQMWVQPSSCSTGLGEVQR